MLPIIAYGTASHKAAANKIWDGVPLHSLLDAASPLTLRGSVTAQGLI